MTGTELRKWVRGAMSTAGVCAAIGGVILGPNTPASAFTATDATNAWNAFNNAFYVGNNGNAYYRVNLGGGQDTNGFWTNAERLEMAIDRAQRSGAAGDKTIVTALVNGFDAQYGTDWTGNAFNDDIMWACIAHLRAYFVTGSPNTAWAVTAANNFNWVYNGGHGGKAVAQVDGTFGGGMWWTNDHSTATGTKNACVNGPAAIAGYYLSVVWPTGTGFRSQAQALQSWEKSHLANSSGNVADHYGPGSTGATGFDLSYNSGTYIGASWLLGDTADAALAATYYHNLSPGILQNYGTNGGNNDGFNGIFMRWMALYMYGSGTTSTYSAWLYQNANAALAVENATGQSWDDWNDKTAASGLYSWDCSPSVVAMNALNPQTGISAGMHTLTPACATGERLDDNAGGTTNGNKIQIWQANGAAPPELELRLRRHEHLEHCRQPRTLLPRRRRGLSRHHPTALVLQRHRRPDLGLRRRGPVWRLQLLQQTERPLHRRRRSRYRQRHRRPELHLQRHGSPRLVRELGPTRT